jgi:hypothetical protein
MYAGMCIFVTKNTRPTILLQLAEHVIGATSATKKQFLTPLNHMLTRVNKL